MKFTLPALPPLLRLPQLPSVCAVCHAWPAQPVCEDCIARFAQPKLRCAQCATLLPSDVALCGECIILPPPLDACFAAVAYTYPWANLIAHFKFHDNPGWARTLAALMRNTPFVEPALERADWVIPMPLSAQRLQERGYNQAWELACNLKPKNRRKTFKHKLDATLLLRVTDTLPQASLHRAERLTNLRTAFAVDPLRAKQLQDKHIVLVDDVMTSGASLYTAALALRAAGARHITGLVFARTDLHP